MMDFDRYSKHFIKQDLTKVNNHYFFHFYSNWILVIEQTRYEQISDEIDLIKELLNYFFVKNA